MTLAAFFPTAFPAGRFETETGLAGVFFTAATVFFAADLVTTDFFAGAFFGTGAALPAAFFATAFFAAALFAAALEAGTTFLAALVAFFAGFLAATGGLSLFSLVTGKRAVIPCRATCSNRVRPHFRRIRRKRSRPFPRACGTFADGAGGAFAMRIDKAHRPGRNARNTVSTPQYRWFTAGGARLHPSWIPRIKMP